MTKYIAFIGTDPRTLNKICRFLGLWTVIWTEKQQKDIGNSRKGESWLKEKNEGAYKWVTDGPYYDKKNMEKIDSYNKKKAATNHP